MFSKSLFLSVLAVDVLLRVVCYTIVFCSICATVNHLFLLYRCVEP